MGLTLAMLAGCASAPAMWEVNEEFWPDPANLTEDQRREFVARARLREAQDAALRLAYDTFGLVERATRTPGGSYPSAPLATLVPPGSAPVYAGLRPETRSVAEGWTLRLPRNGEHHQPLVASFDAYGDWRHYVDALGLKTGSEIDLGFFRRKFVTEQALEPVPGDYRAPGTSRNPDFGEQLEKILGAEVASADETPEELFFRAVRRLADQEERSAFLADLERAFAAAVRQRSFEDIETLFLASSAYYRANAIDSLDLREAGLELLRAAYVAHQERRFARAASLALHAGDALVAASDFELAGAGLGSEAEREEFIREQTALPITFTSFESYGERRYEVRTTVMPKYRDEQRFAAYISRVHAMTRAAPTAYAYGLSYYLSPSQFFIELGQLAFERSQALDSPAASALWGYVEKGFRRPNAPHPSAVANEDPELEVLRLTAKLKSAAEEIRGTAFYLYPCDPFLCNSTLVSTACSNYNYARGPIVDFAGSNELRTIETLFGKDVASEIRYAERNCRNFDKDFLRLRDRPPAG